MATYNSYANIVNLKVPTTLTTSATDSNLIQMTMSSLPGFKFAKLLMHV